MRNFSLLAAFLFITSIVLGQNIEQQIKNDPNIDWAVKTNFQYKLEEGTILKNAMALECDGRGFFQNYLKELTEEIVKGKKSYVIDTIIVFDPKTMKETRNIVKRVSSLDLSVYEVEQIWYHDKSANAIKSVLLSLAPIIDGRPAGRIPLPALLDREFDLADTNVIWASLFTDILNFNDAVLVKGKERTGFRNVLIDAVENGDRVATKYYGCEEIAADGLELGPVIDTIITFNPDTYEEKITIVEHAPLDIDDLNIFGIKQVFFIDEKTKKLHSEVYEVNVWRAGKAGYPNHSIKMK